jgi:hypothetical protein
LRGYGSADTVGFAGGKGGAAVFNAISAHPAWRYYLLQTHPKSLCLDSIYPQPCPHSESDQFFVKSGLECDIILADDCENGHLAGQVSRPSMESDSWLFVNPVSVHF